MTTVPVPDGSILLYCAKKAMYKTKMMLAFCGMFCTIKKRSHRGSR